MKMLIAACGALAFAQTAAAQQNGGEAWIVERVPVSYADLDLSREADARIMLDRLDRAARRACGGRPEFDSTFRFMASALEEGYRECRSAAMSGALTALGAPVVHRAYTGEPSADGEGTRGGGR
jgi:UrcA family protein